METNSEPSLFLDKKVGAKSLILLIIICFLWVFPSGANQKREVGFEGFLEESLTFDNSTVIQKNSFLAVSSPALLKGEPVTSRKIVVLVTGYSSSPEETDDTPYVTASGTFVRDGVVATNILPFGTKIRLPELYEDKIFVVEDRMNPIKDYQVDIWFPDRWQALNFGVRKTYIEIIREV